MFILHFTSEDLFKPVILNVICGEDELSVNGTSSEDAILFIDRLLSEDEQNFHKKGAARSIPIAQRDQILVQLYYRLFGKQIISTIVCENCKKKFDINFNVSEFTNSLFSTKNSTGFVKDNTNFLSFPNGVKLKLPTGDDELKAISSTNKDEFLYKRCVHNKEDYSKEKQAEIESILNQIAPLVKSDLPANCPECDSVQQMHFDIQSFFLQKILNNKKRVLYEIHLLASHYNWSYSELIAIPKKEREQYISFVEKQN